MHRRHTVLVVDDDAEMRAVLLDQLRHAGHLVHMAGDGRQALAQLSDGVRPCLILADLQMPLLDGWHLAERLAAAPNLAVIPLVVLSGLPNSPSWRTPPAARARLTKPVPVDDLLATVAAYCAPPAAQD